MAPKRASIKRKCEAADAPAAVAAAPPATGEAPILTTASAPKRSKLEPIVKALEGAELPEDCRAMLISMVPGCLETAADERQELQAMAVSMIDDVFQARQTAMEQAILDAEAKLVDIEAGRGSLDGNVAKADTELAERVVIVEARKKVLATASQEVVAAKSAAGDAREAQRLSDEEHIKVAGEKSTLEAVLRDHFTPLKEGKWESTCGVHLGALLPVAKRIELDQSLVSAMPSSCSKKPEERGPFDQMVVTQLEELLVQKVAAFVAQLEAAGPQAEERRLTAEAAQKNADEAKERQQQAASEVFSAQASQREQSAALDAAKAAVQNFEPTLRAATEAIEQAKASLEEFRSCNLVCFETARDAKTEVAATPEAAVSEVTADAPAPEAKIVQEDDERSAALHQVAVGGQ